VTKGLLAACGVLALSGAASAEPVIFQATVEGELGYGINPRVVEDEDRGVGFAAITITPQLSKTEALSVTTLSGFYHREQYFSVYGYTDSAGATLARTQSLTEHLSAVAHASYVTSNNALVLDEGGVIDPTVVDPLNGGQRTSRYSGDLTFNWQASARDTFSVGGNASHADYGEQLGVASDYDQYGATGSYSHVLNARTTVGAQVVATEVKSQTFPNSESLEPSLTLTRQLGPIWQFQGHLGLIFEHLDGPEARSTTSLGFGAKLCGNYPRTTLCISGDRSSAPSGFGGLRNTTEVEMTMTHKVTEHDTITVDESYQHSSSLQIGTTRNINLLVANLSYDHDLTRRLSAGAGARYEQRDYSGFGTARGGAVTVHLTAKLGRL
jgi:hypothetical protein